MPRTWIGNDIVDALDEGARDRANDRRFVERVCTLDERQSIETAPDPTAELWRIWSAKEAAFKILSRRAPGLGFQHKAYAVRATSAWATDGHRAWSTGVVDVGTLAVPVIWERTSDYVHCVGQLNDVTVTDRSRPPSPWQVRSAVSTVTAVLPGALSLAERASAGSVESAQVRLLAHQVLSHMGISGAEVIRAFANREWGPPTIMVAGRSTGSLEVSLSHDGRFVAAVVATSPEPV